MLTTVISVRKIRGKGLMVYKSLYYEDGRIEHQKEVEYESA